MSVLAENVENPAAEPGFPYLERLAEQAENRLRHVLEVLARHSVKPVLAAELECYLHGLSRERFPVIALQKLDAALAADGHTLLPVQRERGEDQAECLLPPTEAATLLAQLRKLPPDIVKASSALGLKADFSARPKPEDYGSGLHMHLHLEEIGTGRRIHWQCEDGQPDASLARCLGGLLHLMPAMPALLMPHGGFERLNPRYDAPDSVCWGLNNRSVALRLIDKGPGLHLEFRLPGADCPPSLALLALLAGIAEGLTRPHPVPPPCYGQGEDWRIPLPCDLESARLAFMASPLREWVGAELAESLSGERTG